MLTVIFAFAGVYKITSVGWLRSVRLCCHDSAPSVTEADEWRRSGASSERVPFLH